MENNRFELFTEGDELYAAMLASIEDAGEQVLLESYIVADDDIGRRFAGALIAAAARGVRVRLHLDAAGSLFWHTERLTERLRDSGVQVRWFHRWDWRHPWRYNRRNHRKLLVVDGLCAYVGGYNIHRENSLRCYGSRRWRDTHVRLSGPLVQDAAELFDRFWRGRKRPRLPRSLFASNVLLSNYSRGARRLLNGSFADMLSHARRTIFITTPYFVPERRIQRQLVNAAGRGVDVRLLVPLKSDVRVAQWAARAAYAPMLAGGVRIFEYQPRLLHAKTMVIDGTRATVGTSNFDYRSFLLNYELNLFTHDAHLCARLEEVFFEDLRQSEEIHTERWSKRSRLDRLFELIGWWGRRWL